MPPIGYPGNAITKEARAKAGGGFESAISTPPPSEVTPMFFDDFETGDLSKTTTSDGSVWSWAGPPVNSDLAFSGNNSASFVFGPDAPGEDTNIELVFDFGKALSEVWMEYYWYVPANYVHRDDSPSNNKLMQFNFDGSLYQALTVETLTQGDGTSSLKRFLASSEDPSDGSDNWPVSFDSIPDFIGPGMTIEPGTWSQIRVHFKSSTDGTTADGIAEFFVDGVLIRSLAWPFWKISTNGQINGGYLMGAANSGFADATEFRVDAVKVYDTDPGWAA